MKSQVMAANTTSNPARADMRRPEVDFWLFSSG
jgi:hypothetical protein